MWAPKFSQTCWNELVSHFKNAEQALKETRAIAFPVGLVVFNDAKGFHGIVCNSDEVPPNLVAVYVESGNIWWYPVTDLRGIEHRKNFPSWIVKRLRRDAALKGVATRQRREQQELEAERR
ncbi:hypothetical protein [Schlesneria sp. T3-172]|uniref:hypothetical protein n=1 Tax=Schlesneria sphaerica TaxID=3373610 RepID=UPI0037C9E51A